MGYLTLIGFMLFLIAVGSFFILGDKNEDESYNCALKYKPAPDDNFIINHYVNDVGECCQYVLWEDNQSLGVKCG